MTNATPLEVLKQAETNGLHLSAKAGGLVVEADNPEALTDEWRARLREHKTELLELLPQADPPPLSPADQEDIREALEERASIQEYDGGLIRADAEREARAALRVYRYRLTTSKGWCTLIAPGWDLEDAERDLRGRYGDRLVEVIEHHPQSRRENQA